MSKREDVINAIRALEDAYGRLTPDAVVEAARDPASPLHGYFEWDDAKAAATQRIGTARRLITSVEMSIRYNTVSISAPVYVHDPAAPPNMQGYRNTLNLRTDADAAREALVAEMVRVSSILRRARNLAAVLGNTEHLDDLEKQVASFLGSIGEPTDTRAAAAAA